jgi:hypothetical protein
MPNFMKIRPLGAELYHADGRTDMMKLTVAFYNFTHMPNSLNVHDLLEPTKMSQIMSSVFNVKHTFAAKNSSNRSN